MKSKRRSNN